MVSGALFMRIYRADRLVPQRATEVSDEFGRVEVTGVDLVPIQEE